MIPYRRTLAVLLMAALAPLVAAAQADAAPSATVQAAPGGANPSGQSAATPSGPSAGTESAAAGSDQKPAKITTTDTVTVTAPGEYRVEQEINSKALLEQAPGTSPIMSVAQLPSVNFQAADPLGSYEWAVRISVRGFNQNQLGFTLDDIPLGDMSYGNWNGLHVSRAIIDENVNRIVISQGTGALETASTSNLGGTLQFYSADPSDRRGLTVSQAFGSFNAYRTVGRFESGLLAHNTKFYISGAMQLADKWRGQGTISQNYWQGNAKLVHYIGQGGALSVFFDYSDRREVDYQDVNKVWTQKLGYNWDNYGVWSDSVQAAYACDGAPGVSYPGKVATLKANEDPCDAGYYGGSGLRKDSFGGITYKQAINDQVVFKVTGYGHRNDGRGLWFTPYLATYDNILNPTKVISPISLRTSEYGITRGGALASLAYETGRNRLEGGVWFEGENWDLARRFYGTTTSAPTHTLTDFPTNPFYTQWAYGFGTKVYQLHLQDAFKVTPSLTLAVGAKTVETNTNGNLTSAFKASPGYTAGKYAQGALRSGKPFLPQLGINWKVNGQAEIFADAAYNVRSYVPGGYGFGNSPWGTTQAGFDSLKKTLAPETSWTEEGGFRYTAKTAQAQMSYFHVNFNDRLLAFAQGAGIAGNASILSNAGGVTTNGVDGALTVRLGQEFTLYNGATWNRSTYDSDVLKADGTPLYPTSIKGKTTIDTPEGMYKTSLNWAHHELFANLGADYMSTRYFTYSNDGSVGGRFLTQFGGGYHREELGALKDVKAQVNITNVLNSQYYSSVGTNGFSYSDPLSVNNNTLQVGSPRAVLGTVSARF